jgi:hypothetical protein
LDRCSRCVNNGKDCYRCGDHNDFTFYKEKSSKRSGFRKKKSKKEGMAFQRKVVSAYNKAIDQKVAYETPNSGAIWHMPGDVVTEEALMECKERGTISARGEKQITIKREWLEKAAEEAFYSNKPMLLPFGFKGDDKIYMVGEFDFFLELVQTIDTLKKRIKELENDVAD